MFVPMTTNCQLQITITAIDEMRAQISQVITFNAVNQDPVFFNPNPTKFICGYVGRPFDLNL